MMKVDVYYNFHKKCFSIRSREKENYGKVIGRTNKAQIAAPQFVVNEAGRKKVLKTGQKNVHAYVRGELIEEFFFISGNSYIVEYNPYKYDSFVKERTKEKISRANIAILKMVETIKEDKTVMQPLITAHGHGVW